MKSKNIRNITTDIIEWTDSDGDTHKCLPNAPVTDHDTLCGTDLNDPGTTNLAGAKIIEKRGRPDCRLCIAMAQDIIERYL